VKIGWFSCLINLIDFKEYTFQSQTDNISLKFHLWQTEELASQAVTIAVIVNFTHSQVRSLF